MYIWIGCKLPEEFEQEIRNHCLALNEKIGLDTVAFTLPQHISLKISFAVEQPTLILEELSAFLGQQSAFAVRMKNPERAGNILWLPVEENECLKRLHEELDIRLKAQFGVVQHPFDQAFLFHSTLFIDEDVSKITRMEKMLANTSWEREVWVDTFLLGISETGKPGTYRVIKQIKAKQQFT